MFLVVLPVIAISKGLSLSLLCVGFRAARFRTASRDQLWAGQPWR